MRGKSDDGLILRVMEQAAARMGYDVVYRSLRDDEVNIASGACRVKEKRLLIIDRRLGTAGRWAAIARALKKMDTDSVHLAPLAREIIESA